MKTFTAAIALAALVAPTTAVFAADGAKPREAVATTVQANDLNFASDRDVGIFRARLAQAITDACGAGERLGTGLSPDWQCRAELRRDAGAKLAALRASGASAAATRGLD